MASWMDAGKLVRSVREVFKGGDEVRVLEIGNSEH